MGKIDLHVHTIYSDGEKTPLEILDICKQNNVSILAIADHGNTMGASKAIEANPYPDLTIIPAIEFTATYPVKKANLHILGYGIDLNNEKLNQISKAIMQDAEERVKSFIEKLEICYGITFPEEDVQNIFNSVGNIGRPDVAKLCVKYGHAESVYQAFKLLLDPLEDIVRKRQVRLSGKECIEYIINAGGIPCLAHPIELKKDIDELKQYIAELKGYGLKAVEVYQSKHTPEYSDKLLNIVNELDLLYSVGSDYHGTIVSPGVEVGRGKNNNLNKTQASILSKLVR